MIRHVHGELAGLCAGAVIIDVGGIGYEVMVSEPLREVLADRGTGAHVELATYYAEGGGGPGGSAPRLMGFASESEREFFELLLVVPRLGPTAAIKALILPTATIAKAIELGDTKALETLPGVGKQRARDIITRLQGKMSEFMDGADADETPSADQLTLETLAVLTQIGLGRGDALDRIRAVREAGPDLDTVDEIVRAVFKRK